MTQPWYRKADVDRSARQLGLKPDQTGNASMVRIELPEDVKLIKLAAAVLEPAEVEDWPARAAQFFRIGIRCLWCNAGDDSGSGMRLVR